MPKPVLHDYQSDAVYDVIEDFKSYQKVLVSMATGLGKSVVMAALAAEWPHICQHYGLPDRVLWLAQRDELIWQAAEHLENATGEPPAIEKGNRRISDNPMFFNRRCVVSSNQTMMSQDRRDTLGPTFPGLVLQDEACHIVAPGHMEIVEYFNTAKLCGVTATADRADQVSLGKVFQHVACHYDIFNGVKDGWLCPIHQEYIEDVELDFSAVNPSNGDLSATDLDRIINQEGPLHKIVKGTIGLAGDRQTIVFMPSVASAHGLAALLRRYGKDANSADGTTDEDERRKIVQDYKDGKFQYLINCALWLEGFDAPATNCVVIARPTKSRALYAQMVGRGMRGGPNCPVGDKLDLLVIDLIGASCKHKLVHCADLLGGEYDKEVVDYVERQTLGFGAGRGEGGTDIMSVLMAAACKAEDLKAERRAQIIAEAKLKRRTINPFDVLADSIGLAPSITEDPAWWNQQEATSQQKVQLEQAGIKCEGDLTYSDARRLILELRRRKKDGIASYKMARLLRGRNLNPSMNTYQAQAIVAELAKKKFKAGREDAIRKSLARKAGRPLEYREVASLMHLPEYYVPSGSPMLVKKSGASQAIDYTSKKALFVQQGQLIDNGNRMRFYQDGCQVELANSGIFDLKRGRWIGEPPKPAQKPLAAVHDDF